MNGRHKASRELWKRLTWWILMDWSICQPKEIFIILVNRIRYIIRKWWSEGIKKSLWWTKTFNMIHHWTETKFVKKKSEMGTYFKSVEQKKHQQIRNNYYFAEYNLKVCTSIYIPYLWQRTFGVSLD